jgi:hypothetical protein
MQEAWIPEHYHRISLGLWRRTTGQLKSTDLERIIIVCIVSLSEAIISTLDHDKREEADGAHVRMMDEELEAGKTSEFIDLFLVQRRVPCYPSLSRTRTGLIVTMMKTDRSKSEALGFWG